MSRTTSNYVKDRLSKFTTRELKCRYLPIDLYCLISISKGFYISAQGMRYRVKAGLVQITEFEDIVGEFIDIKVYPFGIFWKSGPTPKSYPKTKFNIKHLK